MEHVSDFFTLGDHVYVLTVSSAMVYVAGLMGCGYITESMALVVYT